MDFTPATTGLATGIGLCAAAGLRCAHAAASWWVQKRRERKTFLESLHQFEQELDLQRPPTPAAEAAWKGYRRFVVERTIAEASDTTSIYLTSEDCRPLPSFHPGQYLTLKVQVPGMSKTAVRCYSLSERPRPDYYRITVKAICRDPEVDPKRGIVSRYLNRGLKPGQILEAQAPRGEFYLREDDARPAVLIGAGIGITPLLSMTNLLLHQSSTRQSNARPVILFYGVRNSSEHAFANHLRELAAKHPQLSYVPCYSQPLAGDRPGRDFLAANRLELETVQRLLPNTNYPCYVCGPGPFMESMVAGLTAWGVAEEDLHYEAFGPSSVKKAALPAEASHAAPTASVVFKQSETTAPWNGSVASLLELGEANDIPLASGCRTGNCGMCATRLLAGHVRYATPPAAPLDPGFCLTCVATPETAEVVLEA